MEPAKVAEYWEANAETWTPQARAGCDVYRDTLNTPAFLSMLLPVVGLKGLDVGCGEGANTRRFDFVTAFMSLMDMPDQGRALREGARVLRPGGFLQFSILHPSFMPPCRKALREAGGTVRAIKLGGYFDSTEGQVDSWWFGQNNGDC